jgi:hypothetical protein
VIDPELAMKSDFISSMFKYFKMGGLVFVLFEDTEYGYRAFESKHSLMAIGSTRSELIEAIKREVRREFEGRYYGKIILRKVIDEEIKL